uniref:Uncharacterized protein n=2 Tax=Diacronema lutheri TaxID=2081491 RepID=A0A7R9URM9_DIALT|mmetsp:Transcript_21787/g.67571  ORF Transcript_21787/g.67571 Transcript_21787/m.67571 type:complete len:309 (+) Transcript_21787:136-1062(+)
MPSTSPAIEPRIHQDTLVDVLVDGGRLAARGALAAVGCGLLAALACAPACFGSAVPLILAAESFEVACDPTTGPCDDDDAAVFEPAAGAERAACTLASIAWLGISYSALLIGALLVRGSRLRAGDGLKLGLLGFATVQLLPALGLSPELPGMLASAVQTRQLWAGGQMAGGITGAWLMLGELPSQWAYKVLGRAAPAMTAPLGVLLAIVPLLAGAPHPPSHERSAVPAELAARFACASLLTTFCFWLVLGPACALVAAHVDPALAPDAEATEALGETSSSASHLVAGEGAEPGRAASSRPHGVAVIHV